MDKKTKSFILKPKPVRKKVMTSDTPHNKKQFDKVLMDFLSDCRKYETQMPVVKNKEIVAKLLMQISLLMMVYRGRIESGVWKNRLLKHGDWKGE